MYWNDLWHKKREERKRPHDQAYWDDFAPRFKKKPGSTDYEDRFFELAGIKEGEKVFDMGCGSGTLTLPLAQKGHYIVAADFSRGMLDVLEKDIHDAGLSHKVQTVQLDWNEDWEKYNLPVCDVAIASRSFIVDDIYDAVLKLDRMGRRKCIIVEPLYESSKYNEDIGTLTGRRETISGDFTFVLNLLFEMGIAPELRYITMEKTAVFSEANEVYEKLPYDPSDEERKLIDSFIEKHKKEDGLYHIPWNTRWAYVSWEKGL